MPSEQPPLPSSFITKTPLWSDPKALLGDAWSRAITSVLGAILANRLWNGSATFNGAGTVTVIFDEAQPDTSYFVGISGDANETFWITGKTVNGFTLHSSNAASTATVDWTLSR